MDLTQKLDRSQPPAPTDDGVEAQGSASAEVRPAASEETPPASADTRHTVAQTPAAAAHAPPDEEETLSPAVRRLVRQYDLDVTVIQGSGPAGRIRVSDVMAHLGGRTYTAQDIAAEAAAEAQTASSRRAVAAAASAAEAAAAAQSVRAAPAPISTLFECDMTNVLAHRKQMRQEGIETVLTSYYLVAAGEALRAVPEAAGGHAPVRLGAVLALPDGSQQTAIVDAADGSALGSLHDRLLAVDRELRFSARSSPPNARVVDLLLHHHGLSGSVVATPTPIGEEHAASIGIGRVRREIAVRDDDASPRVAAMCFVSLSFAPERLELARANRFMAQLVRVLEQWPL